MFHRATSSASVNSCSAATAGKTAMCTDSSRAPGRRRHSSSAVNDRIGAMRRVNPSAIRYIAVCADRRAGDRAAKVYKRSFEISL